MEKNTKPLRNGQKHFVSIVKVKPVENVHSMTKNGTIHCAFKWLKFEAPMSATEAADILETYNKDVGDNGIMFRTLALYKAIARAVEMLRGLEEKNNA